MTDDKTREALADAIRFGYEFDVDEAVDLLLALFDITDRNAEPSEAVVEAAARALDANYNPDRYPVMAATFEDYARTALIAARAVTEGGASPT